MRVPVRGLGGLLLSKSAAILAGGDSMKAVACPSEISKDSSSRRSSSSPAQAWSRNEARSVPGQSSAASSNLSICCHRSGFMRLTFADCPVQPGLGFAQLALDRARCHLEHFGHLFSSEPAEELHLYELALARVHFCQIIQGLVQGNRLCALFRHNRWLGQRHHLDRKSTR